jgi:hypothetical protein
MNITSTYSNKRAKTRFDNCPPNKEGRTTVEVSTYKDSRGNITSTYQYGVVKQGEGYSTFSFTVYQDEYGHLHSEKLRATDKAVQKQHAEAVSLFMQRKGWEVKP